MAIDKDTLEELAWSQPELCQACAHFVPWRGLGWGCEHPKIDRQLRGDVLCGTSLYVPLHAWDKKKSGD